MREHPLRTVAIQGELPSNPNDPATFRLRGISLEFAWAMRDVDALDGWHSTGIYLLLDAFNRVYVGKATGRRGLKGRVRTQIAERPWCKRVLLVRESSAGGFDSAEAGYMESELISRLKAMPSICCDNIMQPFEQGLDACVVDTLSDSCCWVISMLARLGVPVEFAGEQRTDPLPPEPTTATTDTVADLVREKVIAVGETLYCAWPSPQPANRRAQCVVDADSVRCCGRTYSSLSDAATVLTGTTAHGMQFWGSLQGDGSVLSLSEIQAASAVDSSSASSSSSTAATTGSV